MLPFWKSAEFIKAASLIVAALVVAIWPDYLITTAVVEAFVYAALKLFFNVTPELRVRGLWR